MIETASNAGPRSADDDFPFMVCHAVPGVLAPHFVAPGASEELVDERPAAGTTVDEDEGSADVG